MYVPKIGDKGFFTMLEPFDKQKYQKNFEVIALRSLADLQKENLDPFQNVYTKNELTQEDFDHDIENNIPIVVLQDQSRSALVYVPASKIKSAPINNGIRYKQVAIGVNLGLIPDGMYIDDILQDIKTTVKNAISIDPIVKEVKTSDYCYKTLNEHQDFIAIINQNPATAVYKSFKQKYEELKIKHDKLLADYDRITSYIGANLRDSVESVVRPLPEDEKHFVKRIQIEMVSGNLSINIPLGSLRLFLYNKFNKEPEEIYFTYFSKLTNDGKTYRCFTNRTINTDIILKDGEMLVDSLYYMGSTRNYAMFSPGIATLDIIFDQPLNIRKYMVKPFVNNSMTCDKIRVSFFNKEDRPFSNLAYANSIDFSEDRPIIERGGDDLEFRDLSTTEPPFAKPSV